ncbi:MAG: hypothetical protein AB7F50_05745 [Fimbriimonadaceae bacterium]
MAQVLYVCLEGFYTAVVRPLDRPHVVHADGAVLEACPLARERGIAAGASLAEARAVLREEGAYSELDPEVCEPHRDRWLDRLLPYSTRVMPGLPHEAWVDMAGHPDPYTAAEGALRSVAEEVPCGLVAGTAPCRWVAELAVSRLDLAPLRWGVPVLEPVTDVRSFLARLPVALLRPVSPQIRARLVALGHRTIGHVAEVPLAVLRTQFGDSAALVSSASQGTWPDPVVPTYPGTSAEERWNALVPIECSLELSEVLGVLALKLSCTLHATERTAEEVMLVFESEEGRCVTCRRRMTKSAASAEGMMVALHAEWQKARLDFPPSAVRVAALGLRPIESGQEGLWRSRSSVKSALGTVRAAFGDGAVKMASEVPLPRHRRVISAWHDANGWR